MEPPCLFLYPQLRLVNNIQLRKPGYLCIKKRYTVPLSMLEAYDAKFPATRYNLTAESFAIVANTFGMKIPTPVEAAATETAEIIHETPDRTQSLPESKVATTASEPELGSERPPLVKIKLSAKPQSEPECDSKTTPTPPIPANPSSTYTKFVVGKTARDHARLLLSSGNFKKLVAAAFAVDAKTAIEQLREVINARKTRSTKTEHKKPFGISDILG